MLAQMARRAGSLLGTYLLAGATISFLLAWVPDSAADAGVVARFAENLRTFLLFDYGYTQVQFFPIREVLWVSGLATGYLVLVTVGVVSAIALPLGMVLALRPRSPAPEFAERVFGSASTVPVLVWASLLMLLAFHATGVVAVFGEAQGGAGQARFLALLIPILALALGDGILRELVEGVRAEAVRILEEPFMNSIRSRNASEVKHLLIGLAAPYASLISGKASYLVSGAIVVEVIFEWQGLGWQILQALRVDGGKDYGLILASTTVLLLFVLFLRMARELALVATDPRVRGAG